VRRFTEVRPPGGSGVRPANCDAGAVSFPNVRQSLNLVDPDDDKSMREGILEEGPCPSPTFGDGVPTITPALEN
jgi:hypothetical protein